MRSCSPGQPLLISPGYYNETIFRGLDFVLEQARQRGIRYVAPTPFATFPRAGGDFQGGRCATLRTGTTSQIHTETTIRSGSHWLGVPPCHSTNAVPCLAVCCFS